MPVMQALMDPVTQDQEPPDTLVPQGTTLTPPTILKTEVAMITSRLLHNPPSRTLDTLEVIPRLLPQDSLKDRTSPTFTPEQITMWHPAATVPVTRIPEGECPPPSPHSNLSMRRLLRPSRDTQLLLINIQVKPLRPRVGRRISRCTPRTGPLVEVSHHLNVPQLCTYPHANHH